MFVFLQDFFLVLLGNVRYNSRRATIILLIAVFSPRLRREPKIHGYMIAFWLRRHAIICVKVGERMRIGIIGAGASGMAAALESAKNPENRIYLLERQARVGRKLQATGNGRCNLTNTGALAGHYHGAQPEFASAALTRFPPEQTLAWFRSMGLFTVAEPSGRVYPYSDQANSVVDVLRFALQESNVSLCTGWEVSRVRKTADGFQITAGEQSLCVDRLIIACGGAAGSRLGGSLSGYQLLRGFGHCVTKLRPSLVQLKSGWRGIAALKGVRANCCASLVHNGVTVSESTGELQFTDYGLSGPVIFEISREACREGGTWSCVLDFLPEVPYEAVFQELSRRRSTELTADDLLTGILHNRLGRVLCHDAELAGSTPVHTMSDAQLHAVCRRVKSFSVSVTEPMGMDCAQVTAGGARTAEFDPDTMQSRLVPGLYACGEVLDIDGDCGGFNLQWAWSSGRLAGRSAGGLL